MYRTFDPVLHILSERVLHILSERVGRACVLVGVHHAVRCVLDPSAYSKDVQQYLVQLRGGRHPIEKYGWGGDI